MINLPACTALRQKQKVRRYNGHGTDTNHGGRRRNRGRVSGGEVVDITAVLIGDGGGVTLPTDPDDLAAVTALFGQFGRETFDSDSSYEGFISGQIVINCRDYPGKTLREAGLVSAKGTLIAYGAYPATYLPAQSDSIIKEIILTLVLTLTHSSSVQLVIDPALATLTQETGDKRYLRRAQNLSDLNDTEEARDNLELGEFSHAGRGHRGGNGSSRK